mmetsp:Transcript_24656/g.39515  ORF Transcript_24656/g.39515 Transcript_24656/m.39515 type:complete len:453 (+) Transcript_24656:421-1779(+)
MQNAFHLLEGTQHGMGLSCCGKRLPRRCQTRGSEIVVGPGFFPSQTPKPGFRTLCLPGLGTRVDDVVVADHIWIHAVLAHVVQPALSLLVVASLRANVEQGAVAHCVCLDARTPHCFEPLLRPSDISSFDARVDQGTVAHDICFHIVLLHQLQAPLCFLDVSGPRVRVQHSGVADNAGCNSSLQHLGQPQLSPSSVSCLDGSIDQGVEANCIWARLAPSEDEIEHGLCLLLLAGFRAGVHRDSKRHNIGLHVVLAHEIHDPQSTRCVALLSVGIDDRVVADNIRLGAVLQHLAEPLLRGLRVDCPSCCCNHSVVAKGVQLHPSLPCDLEPTLCPSHVTNSSVGFDDGVEADRVWAHAGGNHPLQPALGPIGLASLRKRIHDGAVRDHVRLQSGLVLGCHLHGLQPTLRTLGVAGSGAGGDRRIVDVRTVCRPRLDGAMHPHVGISTRSGVPL